MSYRLVLSDAANGPVGDDWHLCPPSFRDFYAFEQHVATCRGHRGLPVPAQWYTAPVFYFSHPGVFVPDGRAVAPPRGCDELDYELELGLVVGRPGINIAPDDRAWDYVAGLTILNDFSARDIQRVEMAVGLGPAKGKDFATGIGPRLVPLAELADRLVRGRLDLAMTARRNGRQLSSGRAATMHWSWPELIAHASRDAPLRPGDVLGSGTVGGGCILELTPQAAGGWLVPGDVIELEIERLGTLRHTIIARP